MREILFRGKSVYTDKWITGYYIGTGTIVKHGDEQYSVDPETVGQFTGLTDKNGKKIFEGDILSGTNPDGSIILGVVRFGECESGGSYHVGFSLDWFGKYYAGWLRCDLGFWIKFREIEVIGNIHDNPELLEVNHE